MCRDLDLASAIAGVNLDYFNNAPQHRDDLLPRSLILRESAAGTKVPYAIVPRDEPMFAFAGLWENWRDRNVEGEEWIRTCTIITEEPNEAIAPIHDRMPVILPRQSWAKWLGEEPANQHELQDMLKPYPSARMLIYPISTRVNSVKNDDPALIEPVN